MGDQVESNKVELTEGTEADLVVLKMRFSHMCEQFAQMGEQIKLVSKGIEDLETRLRQTPKPNIVSMTAHEFRKLQKG